MHLWRDNRHRFRGVFFSLLLAVQKKKRWTMTDLFTGVKQIPTPDIVRAFFPGVELKRDGSGRQKGLCPLHREDTPSFTVYKDRFKCFGCGACGSNIDLVMKADPAASPL